MCVCERERESVCVCVCPKEGEKRRERERWAEQTGVKCEKVKSLERHKTQAKTSTGATGRVDMVNPYACRVLSFL